MHTIEVVARFCVTGEEHSISLDLAERHLIRLYIVAD